MKAAKLEHHSMHPASRRKNKRFAWRAPVTLTFGDELVRLSYTQNLSEGGMFVGVQKDLPPEGENLSFRLEIGGCS